MEEKRRGLEKEERSHDEASEMAECHVYFNVTLYAQQLYKVLSTEISEDLDVN